MRVNNDCFEGKDTIRNIKQCLVIRMKYNGKYLNFPNFSVFEDSADQENPKEDAKDKKEGELISKKQNKRELFIEENYDVTVDLFQRLMSK